MAAMQAVLVLALAVLAYPASADNAFSRRCEADILARYGDAVLAQRSCVCARKFLSTSLGQAGHDRVLAALEATEWNPERARLSADERRTVAAARLACGL